MSFTRFNYDANRTQKLLQESTFAGRYILNTPGPGANLPFMEDSQVRLQKWGANAHNEGANIESDLRGLTRSYNRDHVDFNNYQDYRFTSQPLSYTKQKPFIEESRASHPAWECLDKEVFNWEHPHFNPQEHLNNTFSKNDSSRLLTKDKYREQQGNESRFEVLLPHYKSSAKGSQQPCYNKKECPFEKTM